MQLMGHSKIETTLVYVQLTSQDVCQQYARAVAQQIRRVPRVSFRKLNANAGTLFAIGGRAGYDSRMAEAVYAIDDFPDDDLLWRIEWFGGVGYNTSVPSDPLIDVCLTQLPPGETNPLSARSRSSQTKRTVKISVGLLPYISIASVWQQQRPVVTDLAACRHQLRVNPSSSRMVA
jgi:hypothetical protein